MSLTTSQWSVTISASIGLHLLTKLDKRVTKGPVYRELLRDPQWCLTKNPRKPILKSRTRAKAKPWLPVTVEMVKLQLPLLFSKCYREKLPSLEDRRLLLEASLCFRDKITCFLKDLWVMIPLAPTVMTIWNPSWWPPPQIYNYQEQPVNLVSIVK
jgi:hypothetical protein